MFGFLRDKLKQGIAKFSKKIEEEGKEEVIEKPVEEIKETKKEPQKINQESVSKTKEKTVPKEEPKAEEKPKGFFGFIKDKFTHKQEEEKVKEEIQEKEEIIVKPKTHPIKEAREISEPKEKKEEKKHKEEKKETIKEETQTIKQEPKEETLGIEEEEPKEEKPKGFFGALKEKITTKKINEEQFESLFWELELSLLENNVAVEVIQKIKEDLQKELVDHPLLRSRIEQIIEQTLEKSIKDILTIESFDLLKKIKEKKPYVICFVGINGSGKTTTIAKVAKLLLNNKLSVVLAAADTFRAAAIDQLQIHANNLGVKLIRQDYGSDPAAVAFDAISHAKSKGIDVVLIDTAGRMNSNSNLTDEMKKIVRVAKPDLKVFVGESITGNDCVEQAKTFNEAIEIDAIILSKADVDEKGGAAVSVSYVTKKPIIYMGIGQEYDDLIKFDSEVILANLGLS